jgi:type I restriction enzyme S subunit
MSLKYLFHALNSLQLASLDRSTAIPGLSRDDLNMQRIPLPPLREQHRIVAVIEELFSDLDAGVASLKRVQANLKRYRASVLKAACEGRLVPTEAELARGDVGAGSPRPYEPADVLLQHILAERRVRWEAGHPGKNYVEPTTPQTDGLSELPEGWCWANVEQMGEVIGGLTKNQKREALPTRLPYLRSCLKSEG